MIDVFIADYRNPLQLDAVVSLLDSYARDPAGGGTPLAEDIKQNLPAALAGRPQMFSVLAFDDGEPIGLVNCIEGFSTFACKPLVNVHDVVVLESHRGQHIVQRMFACVEVEAQTHSGSVVEQRASPARICATGLCCVSARPVLRHRALSTEEDVKKAVPTIRTED